MPGATLGDILLRPGPSHAYTSPRMHLLAFVLPEGAGAAPGTSSSMNPWLGLALGLLLVAINGFFVAAEFALVKVRPTQLDPLAQAGSRRAKLARHQQIGRASCRERVCI